MMEAVGFPARERQYLLGPRREVVLGFNKNWPLTRRSDPECFPQ